MEENFNFFQTINMISGRFKTIGIVSIMAGIITAVISLFIPNYYEAYTTFYAASPDLSSPTPLSTSQNRINIYGNDEDLDRLLSIAGSQKLMEFIIDTFELYEHYGISKEDKKGPYKVKKKLLRHMGVLKTKFGAISLKVEDKEPKMAAAIVNSTRDRIATIAQTLIKESQQKTIESYSLNIVEKNKAMQVLMDTLSLLRERFGIIDASSQGEVLAQLSAETTYSLSEATASLRVMEELNMPIDSINQVKARVAGLSSKKFIIDKQLKQFNEGISIIKSLENQLVLTNDQLSLMNERLKQMNSTYTSPFTALHVVEEATVPVVKTRPHRSLIVIAATLLTFILISLGLLLQESLRKTEWR